MTGEPRAATPPGARAGSLCEIARNLRRWTAAELVELSAAVAGLLIVVRVFGTFANTIELRPGIVMADPVLALLTPRDMTGVIFAAIYASVVVAIVSLAQQPPALVGALRAYAIVFLLRMIVMAVTPLEAPVGNIPLADPVVRQLVTQKMLTRDLFFSGHTATACILLFTARSRGLRLLFTGTVLVVGCSVLLQAVHYTIDVLAAPVFAYAAHRVAVVTARSRPAPAILSAPRSRPGVEEGAGPAAREHEERRVGRAGPRSP